MSRALTLKVLYILRRFMRVKPVFHALNAAYRLYCGEQPGQFVIQDQTVERDPAVSSSDADRVWMRNDPPHFRPYPSFQNLVRRVIAGEKVRRGGPGTARSI
jgi:hypothetical protein